MLISVLESRSLFNKPLVVKSARQIFEDFKYHVYIYARPAL